jgi:hypothetical protein|tara:strand:- start:2 stop:187 length:186 start_codon:yes stop_codon:yes gene_type:complete
MAINRAASSKKLIGNQDKIDANEDGQITKKDFELLREDKDATARMATGGRVMLKPLMRNRG